MNEAQLKELRHLVKGEVLSDQNSLAMYATDASVYQIFPEVIVVPRTAEDVQKVHRFASEYKLSILPRGAGTSLAGQTVGKSIVLDFSKYLNKIKEFNKAEKWITVEPGLSHSELNAFLKPHGLL